METLFIHAKLLRGCGRCYRNSRKYKHTYAVVASGIFSEIIKLEKPTTNNETVIIVCFIMATLSKFYSIHTSSNKNIAQTYFGTTTIFQRKSLFKDTQFHTLSTLTTVFSIFFFRLLRFGFRFCIGVRFSFGFCLCLFFFCFVLYIMLLNNFFRALFFASVYN